MVIFDLDLDNSPEPLLHSFDMVNIKLMTPTSNWHQIFGIPFPILPS